MSRFNQTAQTLVFDRDDELELFTLFLLRVGLMSGEEINSSKNSLPQPEYKINHDERKVNFLYATNLEFALAAFMELTDIFIANVREKVEMHYLLSNEINQQYKTLYNVNDENNEHIENDDIPDGFAFYCPNHGYCWVDKNFIKEANKFKEKRFQELTSNVENENIHFPKSLTNVYLSKTFFNPFQRKKESNEWNYYEWISQQFGSFDLKQPKDKLLQEMQYSSFETFKKIFFGHFRTEVFLSHYKVTSEEIRACLTQSSNFDKLAIFDASSETKLMWFFSLLPPLPYTKNNPVNIKQWAKNIIETIYKYDPTEPDCFAKIRRFFAGHPCLEDLLKEFTSLDDFMDFLLGNPVLNKPFNINEENCKFIDDIFQYGLSNKDVFCEFMEKDDNKLKKANRFDNFCREVGFFSIPNGDREAMEIEDTDFYSDSEIIKGRGKVEKEEEDIILNSFSFR